MMSYGIDRIGAFKKLICRECGEQQQRCDLRRISRYDDKHDENGEPIWIEDYWGCRVCGNEDVEEEQNLVYIEILQNIKYGADRQYEKGQRIWTTKDDAAECVKQGFASIVN
jgi:hypothetical protein